MTTRVTPLSGPRPSGGPAVAPSQQRGGARRALRGALAAAGAVLGLGCGDGTGPGEDVIPAELAATWVAEPACLAEQCNLTLTAVANPANSINITASTGLSTEITLTRTGTFRLVVPPNPAETAAVRAEPGILIVTDAAGTVDTLDYTVGGGFLELHFRRTFTVFDFTGDGVNDPAHARGRFKRR